jgi:hypothetical protein
MMHDVLSMLEASFDKGSGVADIVEDAAPAQDAPADQTMAPTAHPSISAQDRFLAFLIGSVV